MGLDRLGRTTVQRDPCPLPRPATIASRTRSWANRRSPGGPSSTTSAARAASSSDVRQSPTLLPVIAATSGTANRVPSTAAARSDAAQSAESCPRRWPIASSTDRGTAPASVGPSASWRASSHDEERVARRRVVHRSQLGVAGRPPDDAGDLLADGGPLQATQLDLGGVRLLGQGGERAGCVPAADDDKKTVVACRTRQVLHQQLRRFVRAVADRRGRRAAGDSSRPRARAGPPRRTSARAPPATARHRSAASSRRGPARPTRRRPAPAAPPATASTAARRRVRSPTPRGQDSRSPGLPSELLDQPGLADARARPRRRRGSRDPAVPRPGTRAAHPAHDPDRPTQRAPVPPSAAASKSRTCEGQLIIDRYSKPYANRVDVPQAAGHLRIKVLTAAGLAFLFPVLQYALDMLAVRRMTPTAFGTLMPINRPPASRLAPSFCHSARRHPARVHCPGRSGRRWRPTWRASPCVHRHDVNHHQAGTRRASC